MGCQKKRFRVQWHYFGDKLNELKNFLKITDYISKFFNFFKTVATVLKKLKNFMLIFFKFGNISLAFDFEILFQQQTK